MTEETKEMIFLLASIISSTALFVIFRYLDHYKVDIFRVIVINYFVASVVGFFLASGETASLISAGIPWIGLAIIIGILFIVMFYLIGLSSQKAGISVTTVASKMSVIIPVLFSIMYDPADELNTLKIVGILFALVAVFLTIYRKKSIDLNPGYFYLPVILFFGMGVVDSLVKFSQFRYINDGVLPAFTASLFLVSAITGAVVSIFRGFSLRSFFTKAVATWGILLGLFNFGSIYFVIKALNYRSLRGNTFDGSIVFGINNIGIVSLSVIAGVMLFREKLNVYNKVGIAISLISIILLSRA